MHLKYVCVSTHFTVQCKHLQWTLLLHKPHGQTLCVPFVATCMLGLVPEIVWFCTLKSYGNLQQEWVKRKFGSTSKLTPSLLRHQQSAERSNSDCPNVAHARKISQGCVADHAPKLTLSCLVTSCAFRSAVRTCACQVHRTYLHLHFDLWTDLAFNAVL